MLHTSTVISYLQECFAGKPVKITDENSSATFCLELSACEQSFVFVYKFCLSELRLATDLLGGRGIQTSPFLALNPRLPRLFFWLPPLSLDLALVVCEILSIVA